MKQITAREFEKAVALDPAWATTLTEPVEITDYLGLADSPITHLSPLLHFTGCNAEGSCAYFHKCAQLKVAEGTFAGWVGFHKTGLEKIGDIQVVESNNRGHAASFRECPNLKTAEGNFPGFVTFMGSGIEKIGDLRLTKTGSERESASFEQCDNLKVAEGTFPGFVNFSHSGVEKVGKLDIQNRDAKADFRGCKLRLPNEFLGTEYLMDPEIRKENRLRNAASAAMRNQQNPDLEI